MSSPFADLLPPPGAVESNDSPFADLIPQTGTNLTESAVGAQPQTSASPFADLVPKSSTSAMEGATKAIDAWPGLFGPAGLIAAHPHEAMNAVRKFGSEAGAYILEGLATTAGQSPSALPGDKLPELDKAIADRNATAEQILTLNQKRGFSTADSDRQIASINQDISRLAGQREVLAKQTGIQTPGNIDLAKRPVVTNPDGSVSTVRSMSFNENGKEILIPTVAADGSGILSNEDAVKQYRETGQHLGMFDSPEAATRYAEQIHKFGEMQVGGMQDAAYFTKASQTLAAESGVDPALENTTLARLSGAAGQTAIAGMEALVPGIGIPLMAGHGGLASYNIAKQRGASDAAAEDAAVRTAIGLSIFGVVGAGAAAGIAKLLPEAAGALTKFAAQFVGQDAANEVTTRALRAADSAAMAPEGQKMEAAVRAASNTTLEDTVFNSLFAAMGAAKAAGKAREPQSTLPDPSRLTSDSTVLRSPDTPPSQQAPESGGILSSETPPQSSAQPNEAAAGQKPVHTVFDNTYSAQQNKLPASREVQQPESQSPSVQSSEATAVGQAGTSSGLPEGFTSVGASTGADISQPKVTSTKNAVMDAERTARGLSPIAQEVRQTNPETFDMAEKALAENPDHGQNIVKGLLEGTKRDVSEVDEAVLLHEKITTQNERELAGIRALDEHLTPEERAEAVTRYAEMETRLNALDQATHRSGTIWGRLGQFRQRLMADDYTFASMERKARIAKGGALTPEESGAIKKQSAELEKLGRDTEAAIAKATEGTANEAVDAEIRKRKVEVNNRIRKERKAGAVPDTEAERKAILDGMRARLAEGDKPADLRNWIQKLAENIVRAEPAIERDPLLDRLHKEVAKVADLTRPQVRDLLSGYGDVKLLNPDAAKARLRDLKGQLQQVAKIEDMMARQAPKKTGVERRVPSDEERRLIKQVEELKKKGGFVVTDPATQLKSALDAIKTRLHNQIADLDHQVSTRTKIVKTRTGTPYDAEATQLKAERDALKAQFDEIFGNPEMSDEARLKLATTAAERGIAEYERRLSDKDFRLKTARNVTSPELETLRARRDQLREDYKLLEAAAHPERALETALRVYKANLRRQSEQLQNRMARNDYAPRAPKAKPELDPEALALKFEHAKVKEQFTRKLFEWQMANRTLPRKMLDATRETLNTTRALLTSLDLSAVLRQGGFIALGHPLRALRAFPDMFRAFGSERGQFRSEQEIKSRPNAELYQQSKLYLADQSALSLSKLEEAYMSRWAEKIPLVAGSQRAYVTFLNRLRADSFDAMHKTLTRDGRLTTPEEGRAIANYVNVATGRGTLGMLEKGAVGLNTAFFAPRYVASRFQLLGLQPLYGGTAKTRALVAMEYGRYLVGMGAVLALGAAAGGEMETDPRSADFGKIRFGNTRLDPLSGIAQVTVLGTRLLTGETKKGSGAVVPIRGPDVPYKGDTGGDVLGRFLRSKLSPAFGTGWDIAAGEDVMGQPVMPGSVAMRMTVPLALSDIYQTMKEQGVPEGTALGLLSILGMGLQTYSRKGAVTAESTEPAAVGLLPKF